MGEGAMFKKRHLFMAGAAGFVAAYFVIALELKLALKNASRR